MYVHVQTLISNSLANSEHNVDRELRESSLDPTILHFAVTTTRWFESRDQLKEEPHHRIKEEDPD